MERTFFRVFLTILFEHCVKRGIKYSKGMIFRYSFCKIESLKHSEIDFNQINKNSELISPKEKFMFENWISFVEKIHADANELKRWKINRN